MPCYQVRVTRLALEAASVVLLAKAMEKVAGFSDVRVQDERIAFMFGGQAGSWEGGKMTVRGDASLDQNEVRRAYSREAIKAAAKKRGWQVRFQKNDPNKAVVTRRRY